MIEERVLDSPGDLLDAGLACRNTFGVQPWYRGQDRAEWLLRPKVARPEVVPRKDRVKYESGVARRFMRGARTRHQTCPGPREFPAWLFLMQHYGLPTRLLDWSESLLTASFFAVFNHREHEHSGCVWVLNPGRLNQESIDHPGLATIHDAVGDLAMQLPFLGNEHLEFDPSIQELAEKIDRGVVALEPEEIDVRMLVQQSMFTVHGSNAVPDESSFPEESLLKLIIPAERKGLFAHTLASAGVRLSSVFPDLDHLAEELRDNALVVFPTKEPRSTTVDQESYD